MKALMLLLVIAVIGYAAWAIMPKKQRNDAAKAIAMHGLRLGAVLLVVLALALAAYYLPVSTFTP